MLLARHPQGDRHEEQHQEGAGGALLPHQQAQRPGAEEELQACSLAYAAIVGGNVTHADDQLLRVQMPRARRKNVGES